MNHTNYCRTWAANATQMNWSGLNGSPESSAGKCRVSVSEKQPRRQLTEAWCTVHASATGPGEQKQCITHNRCIARLALKVPKLLETNQRPLHNQHLWTTPTIVEHGLRIYCKWIETVVTALKDSVLVNPESVCHKATANATHSNCTVHARMPVHCAEAWWFHWHCSVKGWKWMHVAYENCTNGM